MGLVLHLKREVFLQSEEYAVYRRGFRKGDPPWLEFVRTDIMGDGYLVTFREEDLFHLSRRLPEALQRMGDHVTLHTQVFGGYKEGRYSYRTVKGHVVNFIAEKKIERVKDERVKDARVVLTVVTFTGHSFDDVRMAYEAFRMGKLTPTKDWSVPDVSREDVPPKKGDSGEHTLGLSAPAAPVNASGSTDAQEKQVA